MAQQTAGFYASRLGIPIPGSESFREDLLDLITNLDVNKKAAVFLAAPKTTAAGMNHEWYTDQLPAVSTAGFLEGEDWGNAIITASGRVRLANAVQTFKSEFAVSKDAIEYSLKGQSPGVDNEYEYAVQKHLQNLEQNIDARSVANGTAIASVSAALISTSALMGGIRNWQVQATAATNVVQSGTSNTWGLNASGAWSRSKYLTLHEAMFTAGADPDTLAVDPGVKADITADILGDSGTSGFVRQLHTDPSFTEFSQDIQFLRTDFGRVAVLVDRFIPQASVVNTASAQNGGASFLYERARVRFAFWRPMRHYHMPPGGDHERGYVHSGVTLELLHPRTVGILYNITT